MGRRLVAIIVIPTVTAVILGGMRIYSEVDSARTYGRIERLAELSGQIYTLAHALAGERDITVGYVATNPDPRLRAESPRVAMQAQYGPVDEAARRVRALLTQVDPSYSPLVQAKAATVMTRLDELGALRSVATTSRLPALPTMDRYTDVILDLLDFGDLIVQGVSDPVLAERMRSLNTLARAKEQASRVRGVLYAAILSGRLDSEMFDALQAARSAESSEVAAFQSSATIPERQRYEDTVVGPAIDEIMSMEERAITLAPRRSGNLAAASGLEADGWYGAANFKISRSHDVETAFTAEIIARADALRTAATRSAALASFLVVVLLSLVVVIVVAVVRSMVRPLRRLRAGALDIAGHRMPEVVRLMRESEGRTQPPPVEPIDVDSRDEIGEVARAFDEVHREAVRLAANEAMLRSNVNAMFVNLSRRSQSLIERQLRLIESLEQGEQEESRLANLFRLDHLATRMRRNGENLLVLAGEEPPRRWSQPVSLMNVLRAAISEVEQYERVRLNSQPGIAVVGHVVNDLVHLVAELVENAATFSSGDTEVVVSGSLLSGGGALLDITDSGVGMTPEELAAANQRLAEPPLVDVEVSRRMGLFVVGRLATRHGIRVQLRAASSGGVTALVLLPAQLIHHEASVPLPARPADPAVTGPMPAVTRDTGPLPAVARDTGPMPLAAPLPAEQPAAQQEQQGTSPPTEQPPPKPAGQPPPSSASSPAAGEESSDAVEPAPATSAGQPSARPAERGPEPPEPVVVPSDGGERLPIFDSVESEWFRRKATGPIPVATPDATWQSPADEGWRAAQAARAPVATGTTAAGLPKRVPRGNLVPGSVTRARESSAPAARADVSADKFRERLARLQRGVRQGRAVARAHDDTEAGPSGSGDEEGRQR